MHHLISLQLTLHGLVEYYVHIVATVHAYSIEYESNLMDIYHASVVKSFFMLATALKALWQLHS